MQKYHVVYPVAGDSRVDEVIMSNRATMMRYYVEDSVMQSQYLRANSAAMGEVLEIRSIGVIEEEGNVSGL
ncbi:hypothetical protein BELL_0255g00170 [Botrytis elliptica]|uniref:Uncharacterized protein n=1 Tax=Botrytis elliptica TaxID=278938 RepID=A0A4Z1JNB8_9HELO|nr:hypothetical protein BELL_0255g00170 [Botrytis elliptica]